jgi:hypothetical protein
MHKSVSIVKVDPRNHRAIARENWGLTWKQMKGMHVHHRVRRCDGGTNDASNLYVCSPSFHRWGWHNGEEFVDWATEGGAKGGRIGGPAAFKNKVGLFGRTQEQVLECVSKAGSAGSKSQIREGVGMFAAGFRQSTEHRERCRVLSEKTRKPISIVFPNGMTLSFPSVREAERSTGLDRSTLARLAESGRTGCKGPCKGLKVYFPT